MRNGYLLIYARLVNTFHKCHVVLMQGHFCAEIMEIRAIDIHNFYGRGVNLVNTTHFRDDVHQKRQLLPVSNKAT